MPRLRPTVICWVLLLAAAWATPPVGGQTLRFDLSANVTLDEVDAVVRGHLQRAEALAANQRWDEVIETLRQVTDNRGDRVIAVVPGYYVRLRDYCHRRLAAMPAEALRIYREQVDAQAEQWFSEAGDDREERLRMIVDQFYCSSRGDDALRLLGEAALERGDFGAARGYWEQLLETPPAVITSDVFAATLADAGLTADERALVERYYVHRETTNTYHLDGKQPINPDHQRLAAVMRSRGIVGPRLAYPQGELAPADVHARLVLVSILEGSQAWADANVADLATFFPEARGRLGGREVNYVEALKGLLAESRSWPARNKGDDWPTFAGNAARNRVQPIDFDVGRVRWRAPLTPIVAGEYDFPARRTGEDRRALLSYLPIVVDGNVFVSDGSVIRAYHLETGKAAWTDNSQIWPLRGDPHLDAEPALANMRPTVGSPRFTLTAHDDRLYARMGRPITSAVVDGAFRSPSSLLVCLDLTREGSTLWTQRPPEDDRWAFEGTPVADDDFTYVALRKGGVRPQAHVFCYDAETGALQWRRMICAAETPAQGTYDEITHNLLTLVGDTLYYNTNLGAVAALTKHDGQIRWIVTYPRSGGADLNQSTAHFYRDLTPCVYDRGTLFVAAADHQPVMALDAASGLLRWETAPTVDALHLLGVAGDYLVASGKHQWWIHCRTGRLANVWPPGDSPTGFGRGAIVGDVVLRPTRDKIEVLGVTDGRPLREIELTTRGATGGHLIAVSDSLLIATGEELIVLDRYGGLSKPSDGAAAAGTDVSAKKLTSNPRVDE